MKIDLRFTLETENEEHRKALQFYNSLRRKNRVDVFVELTRQFWGKEIIDGGESLISHPEKKPAKVESKNPKISSEEKEKETLLSHSIPHQKKKNPLFG